jgi:Acyclic terpene utilisation family protein AtuA
MSAQGSLRVGQFTGWHGDRRGGMAELLAGDVDVLTGDYLAELTMLVLQKNQARGGTGYVGAFLDVLAEHVDEIARRGIKVVTNAGGLDPLGLAEAVRKLVAERGIELSVAAVTGDDVRELITADGASSLRNIDTGEELDAREHRVLTANAYLGAWPIQRALTEGADIVICPRVTDASLIIGPAAWRHGWAAQDFDRLAGALVAGHIIECGAQATGGNFAFFAEHDDLGLPGMPIAEIAEDGSAVIEKSPHTGGLVTRDTVVAQLLYEIGPQAYLNPDVVADMSSVEVREIGPDRVLVSGARGFVPPASLKVSLTYEGGYRNAMTIGLTGRHLEAKVAWIKRQVSEAFDGGRQFDELRWSMVGPADTGGTFEESTAWLGLTVSSSSREAVDRAGFADRIVEIATSSVPGFYMTSPPQRARLFGVQWPTLIPKSSVAVSVSVDDHDAIAVPWEAESPAVPPSSVGYPIAELDRAAAPELRSFEGPVVEALLGDLIGTRSGDKAGAVNIGAWARDRRSFDWLDAYLTVPRLRSLMPELADIQVARYRLSNLLGLNFVLVGYLGDGVSASTRIDPQGKGMGEYLASRTVLIPAELLSGTTPVPDALDAAHV